MRRLVELVAAHPVLGLAIVALLLVLAIWSIYRLVRRGRTRRPLAPADLEACGAPPAEVIAFASDPLRGDVRRAFARGEGSLRRSLRGRSDRYGRPWVLSMGPARAGKTTLLGRSHLALPFGGPVPGHPGLNWWSFDRGVVLDVAGRSCLEADTCASDEGEWRALLRRVRRSRRRRPIDGVLLTLPAGELDPPRQGRDEHLARCARRAAHLQRKLAEAQRILGMRFPVYLLVSHCDRVPGFTGLRRSLAPGERQQMFGWSNPAPPQQRFATEQVDRAFDSLCGQLESHQLELLAGGGEIADRESLAALPDRLAELKEPLRIYANHLFLPKADCEDSPWRGLYFCGGDLLAGGEPEAGPEPPGELFGEPSGEVAFVGDLLEHKVFPEASLAVPTARARRRSWRRAVALGLLVAGLAMWAAAGLVAGQRRLQATISGGGDGAPGGLAAFLRLAAAPPPPGTAPRQQSLDLLAAAEGVESFSVRSPLLPASWFGGLQGKVDAAVRRSFGEVVLPSLLASLEQRTASLVDENPGAVDRGAVVIQPVESYPQFEELDLFVGRLATLEQQIGLYQKLAGSGGGSVAELNQLGLELLGREMLPASRGAARYLGRQLERLEAEPFDWARYRTRVEQAVEQRWRLLYRALFYEHRLLQDLEAATASLGQLGPSAWGERADKETYRTLYRGLEKVSLDLEAPALDWVVAETLDLGPRFDRIRRRVHDSRFLAERIGPEQSEQMRLEARRWFQWLRSALMTYGTGYGGPLLVREEGRLALSKSASDLMGAVGVILGEFFMQRHPQGDLAGDRPPDKILLWDKSSLEEALAVFRSYQGLPDDLDAYLEKQGLDGLPRPLEQSQERITAAAAGSGVIGLVAEAMSFIDAPDRLSAEQMVELQVRNLQEVDPIQSEILAAVGELDRSADGIRLAEILRDQQAGILRQVKSILDGRRPYRSNFAAWDGSGSPAAPALAPSVDELADYLTVQRELVGRLASLYARPVLEAYGAAGNSRLLAASEAARWWQRVVGDLDAYARQEAGNPLQRLESFVAGELAVLDLYSYFGLPAQPAGGGGAPAPTDAAAAGAPPPRPAAGYFAEQLVELRRALHARAVELADQVGFRRYRALSAEFNSRLAGRFPFAGADQLEGAAPADLKALLGDEFRRTSALVRNLPDEGYRQANPGPWRFGSATGTVQQFMRQLEAVRVFFGPFLPADAELEAPAFDLSVEFRTLRSNERGANQIIAWDLRLGEETRVNLLASLKAARNPPEPSAEPQARWAYGLPAELTVAWAQDSPFTPLVAEPPARIDGRRLTYLYRDPWSLLRLIAELETPGEELPDVGDGPRPEILGFAVRTATTTVPHPVGVARLYLTLTLFAPQDDTPLGYPTFPRTAPAVPAPPEAS